MHSSAAATTRPLAPHAPAARAPVRGHDTLTIAPDDTAPARRAARIAGVAYLAAAVGFVAVFTWLAAHFDYPDSLERPAGEALPALRAMGAPGRLAWACYALLPLLLVVAGEGIATAFADRARARAPFALRLVRAGHALAALTMTVGLARWSTLHWRLAEAWASASPAGRESLAALFDGMNLLLGQALGEFVGELALYGSLLALAVVLLRTTTGRGARTVTGLVALTGAAGWVGMFRNVTDVVAPVADAVNTLLPLALVALGAWLAGAGAARGAHVARS